MTQDTTHKIGHYLIRNIAAPTGIMITCLLGAFLVYKLYYIDNNHAQKLSTIQPAAGHEHSYKGDMMSIWYEKRNLWQ